MGVFSVSPLSSGEANVDLFLSSDALLFRVSTECYIVGDGDFPNKRETLPSRFYKVGIVSLLHEGYVVDSTWLEMERSVQGYYYTQVNATLPVYAYLDLYSTDVEDETDELTKTSGGEFAYAPDTLGSIFETQFLDPSNNAILSDSGVNRFVVKIKPVLLGMGKVADSVAVTNLTNNVQIDVNLDTVR